MNNNTKIEEYKRYKKKIEVANYLIRFGLLAIFLSIVLTITLTADFNHPKSLIPVFIIIIAFFIILPFAMLPVTIKLNDIITKELDPFKLKYVLENKSSLIYYTSDKYLAVALHTGNYYDVINTCSDGLKTKSKDKRFILNYQSLAYFMLGDITGLKIACSKFEDNSALLKTNSYSVYPIQKLLSLFADEKYSEIAELYENQDYSGRTKSGMLNTEFIYAVTFYKLGETEKAKEIFQKIVNEAPLLNISKLSNDYLSAIEQNTEYVSTTPTEVPQNSNQNNYKKSKGLMKSQVVLSRIGFFLCIFMILVLFIAQKGYNSEIEDAAREYYENCNLIDYYQVDYNGEKIEMFALIKQVDGSVDLCYITETVDTDKTNCHFYAKDLKEGTLYVTHGVLSNLDIMYKVSTNKKDIPDTSYQVFKFKHNGKTQYLYITDITECKFEGLIGHN